MDEKRPIVSVVIVADYGGWDDAGWNDLRRTLRELALQADDVPAELILVDSLPSGQQRPSGLEQISTSLRILSHPGVSTHELLNEAVRASRTDLVAFIDGDCLPAPGWLASAAAAMRAQPHAAAISGRTVYPDRKLSESVLGLLSRAFVDPGRAGPTAFVTHYNAVFRRDVLLDHPLPAHPRVMAERLQGEAIRLAGGKLFFEPGMRVTHRFDGWPMERRIRRNVGYRAIRLRQLDPRVPHAWLVKLGVAAIPLVVAARTLDSFRDCLRVGKHYGVRWYGMPAALGTALLVHLLEIGGMAAAFAEAPQDGHAG